MVKSRRLKTISSMLLLLLLLSACRSAAQPDTGSTPTQTPPAVTPSLAEAKEPASIVTEQVAASSGKSPLLATAQGDLENLEDAPRYTIDLDVDYAGLLYRGQARVDYTNNEDVPLDRLYFRLFPNGGASYGNGSLQVSEVLVNDQPVETELSIDNTVLEVALPEELAAGESLQVDMAFEGQVPRDFGGEQTPAGYGIYNFSEGVMALSGWYPSLAVYDDEGWNLDPVSPIGDSVYSDIAFYSVDVAAENGLSVITTGVVTESENQGAESRLHFESGPVRDFFLILGSDFEVVSREVDGTQINSYYLPGDALAGEAGLQVAADSLQVFNQRFDPYPYSELDLVEAPMRYALGVEYPGIILVATSLYEDPADPSFSVVTAHEVAHQWWYNVVGNDVIDEPWLDEALTTYSSGLYYEDIFGPRGYLGLTSYWQERYDQLVERGLDELITEDLAYFENLPEQGVYSGVVYSKGALFFKSLREEIGDQAFFEALQTYYRENKYRIADSEDLLGAFEQAAGRSLQDFYQQWLYSTQDG